MSVHQLADAITGGGLLGHGFTEDQAADACFLTCSACVFDGYARAGDYLLDLVDCDSREAVQLGRPVPLPPGQPGLEILRGMAAGNVAQGLRLARVSYPGAIVYQSERHHLMAFRRSLVLLFGAPARRRPAPAAQHFQAPAALLSSAASPLALAAEKDVHWPPAEFATRLYTRCVDDFVASGAGIALPSPRTLACILTRAARSCAGCGEEADRGALKSCSLCRSVWY